MAPTWELVVSCATAASAVPAWAAQLRFHVVAQSSQSSAAKTAEGWNGRRKLGALADLNEWAGFVEGGAGLMEHSGLDRTDLATTVGDL